MRKSNYVLKSDTPSAAVSARLSLAQDSLQDIKKSFYGSFGLDSYTGIRKVDQGLYDAEVLKLKDHLLVSKGTVVMPGRVHKSPKMRTASCDPLTSISMYKLKEWMVDRFRIMEDQCFLP